MVHRNTFTTAEFEDCPGNRRKCLSSKKIPQPWWLPALKYLLSALLLMYSLHDNFSQFSLDAFCFKTTSLVFTDNHNERGRESNQY